MNKLKYTEEHYRKTHIDGLKNASNLCKKSSESILGVSLNIKKIREQLERDVRPQVNKYMDNEELKNKKNYLERLYESKSKIDNVLYDLSSSEKNLENISNDIGGKKKKIDELKNAAEKYYKIKFNNSLWTNTSSQETGIVKVIAKVRDSINERKLNKLTYKEDLLVPDEIQKGELDANSEAGQAALKKHEEDRLRKLKKNMVLSIISGAIGIIIICVLSHYLLGIPLIGKGIARILESIIMDKFNEFIGYKKIPYLKAGFSGYILLIADIYKILLDCKNRLEKIKGPLTKEHLLQTFEDIKIASKDDISNRFNELINIIKSFVQNLENFNINKEDILNSIKDFPNNFLYRSKVIFESLRNSDPVVMFFTPKELKSTRKILYKLTGKKENLVAIFMKKLKFSWKVYNERAKAQGINGIIKITEKIILGIGQIVKTSLLDHLQSKCYGLIEPHLPKFITSEFLKNFCNGALSKIFITSKDFNVTIDPKKHVCQISLSFIGEIKKEFASTISSKLSNPFRKMSKEIVLFVPKVIGEVALEGVKKHFDKNYNNKHIHIVINQSINFNTEVFIEIIPNYGGRFLRLWNGGWCYEFKAEVYWQARGIRYWYI